MAEVTAIEIMRSELYPQLNNGERALVERALIRARADGRAAGREESESMPDQLEAVNEWGLSGPTQSAWAEYSAGSKRLEGDGDAMEHFASGFARGEVAARADAEARIEALDMTEMNRLCELAHPRRIYWERGERNEAMANWQAGWGAYRAALADPPELVE